MFFLFQVKNFRELIRELQSHTSGQTEQIPTPSSAPTVSVNTTVKVKKPPPVQATINNNNVDPSKKKQSATNQNVRSYFNIPLIHKCISNIITCSINCTVTF